LAVPKLLQLAVEAGLLGEWAEEILAAAPDYDKMNYLTIPFGMTDQNESVYVRFPMAHESQMLQKMTYLSMKGAMGDFRGEEIARALKSQDPYALSNLAPAIQILNDISQVAIGINPQDSWYGAGKVPQAEFDAGGADRWLAFGKALYNDNIGNSIWKIKSGTESEIRSDMSRYLEVPGVAQMVGRFLKVSGKGREDELRRIAVEQEREDAKVGLGIRRYIGPVVSEMPSTATEAQMKSTARKAYNEAKRTGVVPKDYEFQHFWARFRTLAALKYGTPEERIGRSSSRNVQEAIGYERPQSGTNNGFAPSFQSGFSGGGFQPGF